MSPMASTDALLENNPTALFRLREGCIGTNRSSAASTCLTASRSATIANVNAREDVPIFAQVSVASQEVIIKGAMHTVLCRGYLAAYCAETNWLL